MYDGCEMEEPLLSTLILSTYKNAFFQINLFKVTLEVQAHAP